MKLNITIDGIKYRRINCKKVRLSPLKFKIRIIRSNVFRRQAKDRNGTGVGQRQGRGQEQG
jgi:hypothetical protein